jgi:hypothetical protein
MTAPTRKRTVFLRNPKIGWHEKFNVVVSGAGGQQGDGATEAMINEVSTIFEGLVEQGKISVPKAKARSWDEEKKRS